MDRRHRRTCSSNRDRAAPLLAKLKAEGIGHIIDGKVAPSISGQTFETNLRSMARCCGSVATRQMAEDIDRAARPRRWRQILARHARRRCAKTAARVADAIEDRADDIAVLECIDTGQAHRFMAKAAIRAAENFTSSLISAPEARDGLNTPSEEHLEHFDEGTESAGRRDHTWNTPFMLSTWKIARRLPPAVTVVHKRRNGLPVTADLLAKLVKQAGVPDGVAQHRARIGEEAGKALTEHPAIKAIGFVGESSTGFGDHGAGRADLEARCISSSAARIRDRVRRC